jgi:glycosyl transferase, family 25
MIAQLGKIGIHYEIVEAVDGRDLDLTNTRLFDPAADGSFHRGAFGCALSHLAVYRKVLADGQDAALVLEDDIIPPADLGPLIDATAQNMAGAEVVLLNFRSYDAHFTKAGWIELPSARHLIQVVDKGSPWSTAAYLITREACARMARTVLPVRILADNWASFYREGALDRVRCVVPMPIGNNVAFRTTSDNYPPGSVRARAVDVVATVKVPILYQALALRRRRTLQRYKSGQVEFVEEPHEGDLLPLMWRDL